MKYFSRLLSYKSSSSETGNFLGGKMAQKRHTITMPGAVLDALRENDARYENDARFATKRRKTAGKKDTHAVRKQAKKDKKQQMHLQRIQRQQNQKERQKQHQQQQKKNKQPPTNGPVASKSMKKRVSFSNEDDIRHIPARDSPQSRRVMDYAQWERTHGSSSEEDYSTDEDLELLLSEDDSQDEEDENNTMGLIDKLKALKRQQLSGIDHEEDAEDAEDQKEGEEEDDNNALAQLKALKGNKKSTSDFRIIKEDDLEDDEVSDLDDDDDEEEEEDDDEDEEQKETEVLAKLKALKGNKKSNSQIRIVKEDDLEDDEVSDLDDEEDDEEEEVDRDEEIEDDETDALAKLKALKGNKTSKSEIRIIKEDELEDDEVSDLDDDEEDDEEEVIEEEESDALAKLKALKGNKKSKSEIRIVKEDDLEEDEVSDWEDDEIDLIDIDDRSEEDDEADVLAELKALKGNKKSNSEIRIVKEDDLEDDEISELDDDEESESEVERYAEPLDAEAEEDARAMDYYAKKLGLKNKKGLSKQDDDDIVGGLFEGLDFMDQYIPGKPKKEKDSEDEIEYADPDAFSDNHDDDMDYYAKKLGIDPKKGLSKEDDDDIIGGLFDGLDFMSDKKSKSSKKAQPESESDSESMNGSDDEINEDDFDNDDDLDEDDKALLREMYGLGNSDDDNEDSEFDSNESDDDGEPKVRENPYVAPVSIEDDHTSASGSRYIPPAMRKKLTENGDSEELKRVMRLLKAPFNKLSEPNMTTVINELNNAFNDNPRHYVNEAIMKIILQSVVVSTPMLDSFLVLYASALVALYKLQGVDFGAFAVQKLIEEFNTMIENPSTDATKITNLMGLLGFVYTLNLVNAQLIYDIIKDKLIRNVNELKTDLLLKLIRSSGSRLRSDDADALKDISSELNKSIKQLEREGVQISSRTNFLVDTINNLKTNKLKNMENENTNLMINRIKKQLGAINNNRNPDPIKVRLLDIEQIEEKGKWWLVGSAWKGNDGESRKSSSIDNDDELLMDNGDGAGDDAIIGDLLGNAEPNWLELAKAYRMNTDVRRAIFVSIMSAEDYMDSFMKLEKLRLKKSQKGEILNILMHCATMESTYNAYYAVLAKKLCDDHLMRRSLQLNMWDFLKELDGDDAATNILGESEDEERLAKILNMGRFFGTLIGEGSLSLNILRVINFLTASSDVKIFLEILLITFLDTVGKKSEIKAFGSGKGKSKSNDVQYSGKLLAEKIAKCDEQPLLLKGLQYFLNSRIVDNNLIKGKKQTARVQWGVATMGDMITEMLEQNKDA